MSPTEFICLSDPDLIKYGVQCSEDLGACVYQQHRVGRIPSENDDSLSIKGNVI